MGFTNALDSIVTKDTAISDLTGTASIYSVQQAALVGMTPALYNNMYDAYDGMLAEMQAATNMTNASTANDTTASGNNPNSNVSGVPVTVDMGAPSDMNSTSTDVLKQTVVAMVMKNLNMTGDSSYFTYLMSLGPGLSDTRLEADASNWSATHSYNNPQVLPADVVSSMTSGNVSLYIVSLSADPDNNSTLVTNDINELRGQISQVKASGGYGGINAYVTGSAAMNTDTQAASSNDMSNIDMYTVLVVLVLLLLYFRSILTPFVPLVGIMIAIIASLGAMTLVTYFMSLYYIVEVFMIVLMMGAGIDYSVFMLSRYSEERRNGVDVKAAVIAMVEHAGKSIASSGLTAALGFAALTLSGQGMFISMGIGVSLGILISMLVSLTLIPAVLTLVGDRMFWPNKLYNSKPKYTLTGFWESITKFGLKHAKAITVLAILLVIPAGYIAMHMNTGMDTVSMLPTGVDSKTGYTIMTDAMGSGTMDRAMITVTLPVNIIDGSGNATADALNRIQYITSGIAKINGVDQVYSITSPDGAPINYQNLSSYPASEQMAYLGNLNSSVGQDDRTTVIYASFTNSPFSNDAYKSIDDMRSMLNTYDSGTGQGTVSHVGGESAMMHDVGTTMTNGFYFVIPFVVVGILIILLLVLRSVLLPLRMILTLSLSILITVAVFTLVFQYWQSETIIFMLPMMLFCSLMGTGVDYDIFLVSRIREEKLKGMSNRDAIMKGVKSTGTIIAICAFIMGGAFSTLMLSKMQMMQQMGFVLFFGILFNALVMLLFIVPAIMLLKGKYNWWFPGQKDKRVMEEEIKA
jgi:RND superfamily putative drug exporter